LITHSHPPEIVNETVNETAVFVNETVNETRISFARSDLRVRRPFGVGFRFAGLAAAWTAAFEPPSVLGG